MHVVWQTWHEPFGATVALNEDPDGDGTAVTMNIRMPGQYFDAETGLHYNWHRYYDPAVGRYMEAEALTGGYSPINPYFYADNSPLEQKDRIGCASSQCLDLSEAEARWRDWLLKYLATGFAPCDPERNCPAILWEICPRMGSPMSNMPVGTSEMTQGACLIRIRMADFNFNKAEVACGIDHELCELSGMDDCEAYTHQIACLRAHGREPSINLECRRFSVCFPSQPPPQECSGLPGLDNPSTGY